MLELLPSPPSIIPPPINLFVWLRPLCCGGQRVWPEYFEVDSCSTHTLLHLTAVLRKSLKEYTNGLSRCENVIDWIILSSSLPHRYKVRAQAFRVCVCLSVGFSVCVSVHCFRGVFSVTIPKAADSGLQWDLCQGSLVPEGRTWWKAKAVINLSETRIKAAVSEHSLGCWSCSGTFLHMSLCLPDWKHPSRTDLYSFFLLMLSTIHKLRRESVLSLKFDERPNETNLVWRLKFND